MSSHDYTGCQDQACDLCAAALICSCLFCVVKAYMTDDFFEHRQPIMQEWADYLTETMGPVIPTTRT